jgi:hypothetical protein
VALAQILAGHQVDRTGGVSPLPRSILQDRWQRLATEGAGEPATSDARARLWHEQQVTDCERAQQWFGAVFHLEKLLKLSPNDQELRKHYELARERLAVEDGTALARRVPPRNPRAKPQLIDLTPYYNALLTEGWLPPLTAERIRDASLAALPRGVHSLGGTEFDLRGLIQLTGLGFDKLGAKFPASINHIAFGRKCQRLSFLHGAGWTIGGGSPPDGTRLGSYVLHYANRCDLVIPIICGQDVGPLYARATPATLQHPALAWVGTNTHAQAIKQSVFLYKISWENPMPQVEITSFDFTSALTECAPFLIAVTTEP